MKKLSVIALALVLCVSLCACRMNKPTETTPSTTVTTVPSTRATEPKATNIPDETVNDNSTRHTDMIDDFTDAVDDIFEDVTEDLTEMTKDEETGHTSESSIGERTRRRNHK